MAETDIAINDKRLDRVWRCFDDTGRLQRWPSKRAEQILVLWIVWSFLPSDTSWNEREISSLLGSWHDMEDYAMLRRDLCDLGLMRRTPDGRVYRKMEPEIPAEAEAAIAKFEPGAA